MDAVDRADTPVSVLVSTFAIDAIDRIRVLAPSLTGYGDKAHLLGPEVGLGTHIDDVAGCIHRR